MFEQYLVPLFTFQPMHVFVIGDFMLDVYVHGNVERVSPEAPVPVVSVQSESHAPGGAGNVASNLSRLGMEVSVCGQVGADQAGNQLIDSLSRLGCSTKGLFSSQRGKTSVKRRIIANQQHICRVDNEQSSLFVEEEQFRRVIEKTLPSVDLVLLSDYAKGVITPQIAQYVIESAKKNDIPVFVDPKERNLRKYCGATLIKPNEREAREALNNFSASIREIGTELIEQLSPAHFIITCASHGMFYFSPEGQIVHSKAQMREIADITGAGDTVLAALAYCYLKQIPFDLGISIANIAAGKAVEKLGCYCPSQEELLWAVFQENLSNKILAKKQLKLLWSILIKRPTTLFFVDHLPLQLSQVYQLIQYAIQQGDDETIKLLCIRDGSATIEAISFLASMSEIDAVLPSHCLREENIPSSFAPHSLFRIDQECQLKPIPISPDWPRHLWRPREENCEEKAAIFAQ